MDDKDLNHAQTVIWRLSDKYRGRISLNLLHEYLLILLFLKFISDIWQQKFDKYLEDFNGNEEFAYHLLDQELLVLRPNYTFNSLKQSSDRPNFGERVQILFYDLERANSEKLRHIGLFVDFTDTRLNSNEYLLYEIVRDIEYLGNLGSMPTSQMQEIYSYLLSDIASQQHSNIHASYTPSEVSVLLSRIADPMDGETVYDPACGSGSLLIEVTRNFEDNKFNIYGQELDPNVCKICVMNFAIHDILQRSSIINGDTLRNPMFTNNNELHLFDVIVSNPPVGGRLNEWELHQDIYKRFIYSNPPSTSIDVAFIQHIIASLHKSGRAVILVTNGVLFRAGRDGNVRQNVIEDNYVDVVISLPSNLLNYTNLPCAILVLKKDKQDKSILFIDASNEYETEGRQNKLKTESIARIIKAYLDRDTVDGFAYLSNISEVANNNYQLNVERYVIPIDRNNRVSIRTNCAKPWDVFISYSRKDSSNMKVLSKYLRENQFNVWTDENLEVGTPSWQAEIAEAIENSCAVVVLLSPDSKKSDWVIKELNYANAHKVKIFPVLVEGSQEESVPLLLIEAQYHEFLTGQLAELNNLVVALNKHLSVKMEQPFIYDFDDLLISKGWDLAPLEEFVVNPTKTKGESEDEAYPQYSPTGDVYAMLATYDYEGEHLLVARTTSSLVDRNKPIAFTASGRFSTTNNVIVLKPRDNAVAGFLTLALSVLDLTQYVNRGTIPTLNKKNLLSIRIPKPSYDEQKSIAEDVTERLQQIKAIQEQYHNQIDVLDTNALSIVRRVFSET